MKPRRHRHSDGIMNPLSQQLLSKRKQNRNHQKATGQPRGPAQGSGPASKSFLPCSSDSQRPVLHTAALKLCTRLSVSLENSWPPRTSERGLIWKHGLCRCN